MTGNITTTTASKQLSKSAEHLPDASNVFASSANVQPKRIVIQGVRGAFHEIAARKFFGNHIETVPALSFRALFNKAEDPEQSDCAVMAIENSIAGSILGNYKLLKNSKLRIIGEIFLPICQNLLALPGVSLEQITEVHSHPMALAQCADFLSKYPRIRLVESEDTAESAARIARKKLKHTAAIASSLAAEIYGLDVLAPSIEDNPLNFTRFLALVRDQDTQFSPEISTGNSNDFYTKVSLSFTTRHQPGNLSEALSYLAAQGTNLTKIQSMPIEGKVWEYQFFVDFTHPSPQLIPSILDGLRQKVQEMVVFGVYSNSEFQLA